MAGVLVVPRVLRMRAVRRHCAAARMRSVLRRFARSGELRVLRITGLGGRSIVMIPATLPGRFVRRVVVCVWIFHLRSPAG